MSMFLTYIEQGNYNLVVSAQRDNSFSLPDSTTFEIYDSKIFSTVLEALAEKKQVRFFAGAENLTLDDFVINEYSNMVKSGYIFSLHAEITKKLQQIPQYTYYRFSYLNNLFASKGFFITNENREEVYIQILETEDEFLITKLEELLKIINLLDSFEKQYQCFLNALDEMEMSDDEDRLKEILNEAKDFFKSNEKSHLKLDFRGWLSTIRGKFEEKRDPDPKEISQESSKI